MVDERLAIFIDSRNIITPMVKLNLKVDWLKLRDFLAKKRTIIKTYFFDGHDEADKKAESFYTFLRANGFKVITRPLKYKTLTCNQCKVGDSIKHTGGKVPAHKPIIVSFQKGVDVALVTELLRMARENIYDTAIIVGGDNDFTNAVSCIDTWGKRVEIASFQDCLGDDLKKQAENLIILDKEVSNFKR